MLSVTTPNSAFFALKQLIEGASVEITPDGIQTAFSPDPRFGLLTPVQIMVTTVAPSVYCSPRVCL
jgi:hypothetical protein